MKKTYEIKVLLEEHSKFHNKAIDWLIASWSKTGAEKQLCMEKHEKYMSKAHEVTKLLLKAQ